MTSKYENLENYLAHRSKTNWQISLSFKEVEQIIGAPLPRSAYVYREWWSNQSDTSNRPQARAWIRAGYLVEQVNQKQSYGSVSFILKDRI